MEILIKHIILILATWRISVLFVEDFGPFNIFYKIRNKVKDTFLEGLFECINCFSIWTGFIMALLVTKNLVEILALTFAYSAGAILINKWFNK